MIDFDNKEELQKIDPQNTVLSTENLVKQLEQAWKEVNEVTVTHKFSDIKNIVFCGMGASIYGALVLKALQGKFMKYPSEVISDYHLPEYVNHQTLVVLTSYSGSTEEVLSCAEEALSKQAKMVILTKGGELAEFAKKHNITAYIFDGKLNPSGTPRLGAGYTILGLLGLIDKTGILSLEEQELEDALKRLSQNQLSIRENARKDYQKYINKIPVIFAAEHLAGNAQIFRNQFNETSKSFSAFYLIPDLNHHLMEGLLFPTEAPLAFISFFSPNYSPKIQKRVKLTTEVVKQNKRTIEEYETSGASMYDDFFEMLLYGSYVTLYLALYYNQNPAINPWVDYFKNKLAEA